MKTRFETQIVRYTLGTLLGVGCVMVVADARAAAVSVFFDSFPDGTTPTAGTVLGAQYASQGLVFYPSASGHSPLIETSANAPVPPFIAVGPDWGLEFVSLPFTMNFSPPVGLVEMGAGTDCSNATATLTAYDSTGTIIGENGPLPTVGSLVPGSMQQEFVVGHASGPFNIASVALTVNGPGGPNAIQGCDQLIGLMAFVTPAGTVTPPAAPTITLTSPAAGNGSYDSSALVAAGSVGGTNLYSINVVVTALNPPPSGAGTVAAFTNYFQPSQTGTAIPFSYQLKSAGQLPVGNYNLTAIVTDLQGQTSQTTVAFSNIPAAVTNAAGSLALGQFDYSVIGEDCEIAFYQGGGVAYEPENSSFAPIYVPTPIAQKWQSIATAAFPPPVFYPYHGLGCPVEIFHNTVSTIGVHWLIQLFEHGAIYAPLGGNGSAIYVPSILEAPVIALSHNNDDYGQAGVYSGPLYYVGWPVSDPTWELDANNPTWVFQRFDQYGLGPVYQNTLEVRGRNPVLYVERLGGDMDELGLAQAGTDGKMLVPPVVSGTTPTIWQQYQCQMGSSDTYPSGCTVPTFQPAPATGTFSAAPTCGGAPVDCDVSCDNSGCGNTFQGINGGLPNEWYDLPDAEYDYENSAVYQAVIRNLDHESTNLGSQLANEDYPFSHEFCNTTISGVYDEGKSVVETGINCATGCTAGLLDYLFGSATSVGCEGNCNGSDIKTAFGDNCNADWTMHTRPLLDGVSSTFVAIGGYVQLGGQADFEIEFEQDFAIYYSTFFNNFRPTMGDLAAFHGRHIVDCGHCPFKAEIHPPDMMMYSRSFLIQPSPGVPVSGFSRGTDVYLWANKFLGAYPVTMTAYAPPRPAISAQLAVSHHENGYYMTQNMAAVQEQPIAWGANQITLTGSNQNLVSQEGDDGMMAYPEAVQLNGATVSYGPLTGTESEYVDHWQLTWSCGIQNIVGCGGLPE